MPKLGPNNFVLQILVTTKRPPLVHKAKNRTPKGQVKKAQWLAKPNLQGRKKSTTSRPHYKRPKFHVMSLRIIEHYIPWPSRHSLAMLHPLIRSHFAPHLHFTLNARLFAKYEWVVVRGPYWGKRIGIESTPSTCALTLYLDWGTPNHLKLWNLIG